MANHLESIRVPWSETDERFFRIVRDLFAPAYLSGASVLLAGYDDESVAAASPAAGPAGAPAPESSIVSA